MQVIVRPDKNYPVNTRNENVYELLFKRENDITNSLCFTLNELFDIMYALIRFFKHYMESNKKGNGNEC